MQWFWIIYAKKTTLTLVGLEPVLDVADRRERIERIYRHNQIHDIVISRIQVLCNLRNIQQN